MIECPPLRANPGASRAGRKAAERMSPEQRSERARRAGNAVCERYGTAYYSALAKLSRRGVEKVNPE